jgi:hypothetical protein
MRPPNESHGDQLAARRLFARLDESLRAAARGRWSTAKRTRNEAALNLDPEHSRVHQPEAKEKAMERDPSLPPDVTSDDDDETRPFTSPDAPDAPQPSAPQPQTPQTSPPVPEQP